MVKSSKQPVGDTQQKLDGLQTAMSFGVEGLLWHFYHHHQRKIWTFLAIVCVSIMGIGGYQLLQNYRDHAMEEAYLAAIAGGNPVDFAVAYPSSSLAALIFMDEAQRAFAQDDFLRAADLFRKAQVGLEKSVLLGGAYLGEATAIALSGDLDTAESMFAAITTNEKLLHNYRSEAAYQLILIAMQQADQQKQALWLDFAHQLPDSDLWDKKMEMLEMGMP